MGLRVNLRLLRERGERLVGELASEEWASGYQDELVVPISPLRYDLEAELQGENLFLKGPLSVRLNCTCGRCLKTYVETVTVSDFAAFIPLSGEDSLPSEGDIADLTALLREDMYLALPANPVCKPECRGLARKADFQDSRLGSGSSGTSSPWSALDQLSL